MWSPGHGIKGEARPATASAFRGWAAPATPATPAVRCLRPKHHKPIATDTLFLIRPCCSSCPTLLRVPGHQECSMTALKLVQGPRQGQGLAVHSQQLVPCRHPVLAPRAPTATDWFPGSRLQGSDRYTRGTASGRVVSTHEWPCGARRSGGPLAQSFIHTGQAGDVG